MPGAAMWEPEPALKSWKDLTSLTLLGAAADKKVDKNVRAPLKRGCLPFVYRFFTDF